MDAKYLLNPSGVPGGWRLVCNEVVSHPDNIAINGALIQNAKTGMYAIHAAGHNSSCPQRWAADRADTPSRIKWRRIDLGMTQEALAAALDVAKVTAQTWEQGTKTPSRLTLRAISDALLVDVEWLMDGYLYGSVR